MIKSRRCIILLGAVLLKKKKREKKKIDFFHNRHLAVGLSSIITFFTDDFHIYSSYIFICHNSPLLPVSVIKLTYYRFSTQRSRRTRSHVAETFSPIYCFTFYRFFGSFFLTNRVSRSKGPSPSDALVTNEFCYYTSSYLLFFYKNVSK